MREETRSTYCRPVAERRSGACLGQATLFPETKLEAAPSRAADCSTRRTAAPTRRYGPAVTGRSGATRRRAASRSRPNAGAARYRSERGAACCARGGLRPGGGSRTRAGSAGAGAPGSERSVVSGSPAAIRRDRLRTCKPVPAAGNLPARPPLTLPAGPRAGRREVAPCNGHRRSRRRRAPLGKRYPPRRSHRPRALPASRHVLRRRCVRSSGARSATMATATTGVATAAAIPLRPATRSAPSTRAPRGVQDSRSRGRLTVWPR